MMADVLCRWKRWGGAAAPVLLLLLFLAGLLANVAAARELQQTADAAAYNTLQLEVAKTPSHSGTRRFQARPMAGELFSLDQYARGRGRGSMHAKIIHRYSLSSPFRPANATRLQRTHETILRDQLRVAAIQGRINEMVSGVRASRTFERPAQIPAQDFEGPIVSGLSLGSGEYFVRVSVGTPPKSMYLVVDTGSDLLWLQCAPCTNCYKQSDAVYDPSKSSTYAVLGCTSPLCLDLDVGGCQANKCLYQVDYGDGSFTTGEFATDSVALDAMGGAPGQVVLNKIPLGCGHDNEGYFVGAAGLLGLGKGPLSFPNQVDPATGGKFSYCLTDRETDTTDTSFLVFGDAAVPAGAGVRFTPLARNAHVATFYYVELTGISVGGALLAIPAAAFALDAAGNGGVILDSGTSVTRLENAAYAALRDAFRAGTGQLPATAGFSLFDTCFDLSGRSSVDVPTVTLHFQGGADMPLPAANYLIPVDNSNTFCLAFAATTGPSIIGNVQQQGFRVIYDNANNQVAFLSGQCS